MDGIVDIRGDVSTNRIEFHAPMTRDEVVSMLDQLGRDYVASGEKNHLEGYEIIAFDPPRNAVVSPPDSAGENGPGQQGPAEPPPAAKGG